ncbi:hypothetical protein GH714_034587 [Hevea brasiliensis]|uniref:Uncharacterized protein n=1 Tax=Hevea brasiliensis TaxID=3981 RepID=A0A6A6K995_HEVBR|nr:hypothetical protein GH714_034587 [Hevea brasiliensis]
MIAAVSWVPKEVAKSVPAVADPPCKEEIEEMIEAGALERSGDSGSEENDEDMDVDTAKQTDEVTHALAVADALGGTTKNKNSVTKFDDITDGLKELDMDHYDEEDEGIELFSTGLWDLYYPSNDMDPYLKDKDDDDWEELEDMTIKPKDAVIVCARNEDEFSHLEVWIFEESVDNDSNMYVHHDIVLSAFPLCTAWLHCPLKGEEKGNFVAVGSMEPSIEIWDLDIVQAVAWNRHEPQVLLSGSFDHSVVMVSLEDGTVQGFDIWAAKSDSTSDSKPSFTLHAHDKAVCTVSYNPSVPNVKLWDLSNNQPSCVASKNPKAGAVFSISFSEDSPFLLAIGGSKGKLEVWDTLSDAGISRDWETTASRMGLIP